MNVFLKTCALSTRRLCRKRAYARNKHMEAIIFMLES